MLTSTQDLNVACFATFWTYSNTAACVENAPTNCLQIRQLLMKDLNEARFAAFWTRLDTAARVENAPTNRL
ncbi:hypothetical protein K443DRAFT_89539 [Laccaria amethystina LaAM-08-1]|uniref:Uncharacterized protein n=1 Tax=Laccaria amethystina LaAM-08-1 TaxID=1095629 RepID=A0A0C9XMI1_9AGAR|nr:hypothetical protein K443DRAFT_89539 [Laccaria amethystina LaAM-08-1]